MLNEADRINKINFTNPLVKEPILLGGGTTTSIVNCEELANILNERMKAKSGGGNQRLAIMLGWLTKDKDEPIKANIPSEDRSRFAQTKYKFFLEAPFEISNKCCTVMKKAPLHEYSNRTKKYGMTAEMAAESRLRTQKWIQNGCNGFHLRLPKSTPMAFWTEQDVLLYIKENNLPICSVYGEVVCDYGKQGQVDNQISLSDLGLFDNTLPLLKTTGCDRTGCVLCGFGAQCHGDTRFVDLKETHPKFYNMLDIAKNNGVTYREAIEWANDHGNLNIKL